MDTNDRLDALLLIAVSSTEAVVRAIVDRTTSELLEDI